MRTFNSSGSLSENLRPDLRGNPINQTFLSSSLQNLYCLLLRSNILPWAVDNPIPCWPGVFSEEVTNLA